jgi:peptidoglycan/xylan/chitin deacetylase (PgdA/CDA1 family)
MFGRFKKTGALASRLPGVTRGFLASTRPRRFLILCYHRVNDDGHPFFGGTGVSLFRRQMEALRRNFTVLPLTELAERARLRDLPRNGVAVTFDDGYRDNYTNAFPVLRALDLPATIFLATDAIDGNALLWHDRVFDGFQRTRRNQARFENEVLSLAPAERRASLAIVLARLRRSRPQDRDRLIERLLDELGIEPGVPPGWEKLRWREVREMASQGISFGAHTLDHPILTWVGEAEARRQVRESKRRIEEELRLPVKAFAYPNGSAGDFDESTRKIVEEEGLSLAVTTLGGANDAKTNPYVLRRTGMWGDDPELSILRLGWARVPS